MNEVKTQIVVLIPKLRRYARALTQDKERADDLVQDALERALTKVELWKRGTDLRAWLFTVLHNVYINNLKKHHRGGEHVPFEVTMAHEGYADTQLVEVELKECLAAMDRLPLEQREVMILVALEEMSYAQVADVVGAPIGTVMSRLSRARHNIRKLMDRG